MCLFFITWEMRNFLPIEFVGNSNFNFIQHVQNVKFCQSNAVRDVLDVQDVSSCYRMQVHKLNTTATEQMIDDMLKLHVPLTR